MRKIRVYKLAQELNKSSKELIEILNDLDVEVSSHMSTVEEEMANLIRDMFNEDNDAEIKGKKLKTMIKEKELVGDLKEKQSEKRKESFEIIAPITVKVLAEKMNYPSNKLIKALMNLGVMAVINQSLDRDILLKLADKLGVEFKLDLDQEDLNQEDLNQKVFWVDPKVKEKPENLELRPPIVTVMGHVDHGKTTLLDAIRHTNVVKSEAGGITQHIGAYQVMINNKMITFIDTPGHEAFTAMRARGAQVTDITILVVSADDGVMPQTIEAINHAKAAQIPIIVAINKIDRPNAQPERVKQQLAEHGLIVEDWGGDTISVPISALKKENIDELLEMVLLVAEMEEIKANPNRLAEGVVIESKLDKGCGPVATILIKNGTMHIGDPLLVGLTHGKVKAMINDKGKRIKKALPSTPISVLGFSEVPAAGDFVQVLADEKMARQIAEKRLQEKHAKNLQQDTRVTLEDLYNQIQQGEVKELNIIIKAGVHGSIEALRDSLIKLSTKEVTINIIHTGVGAINGTDVNLASASNAIIIGFNVRPDSNARVLAEKEKVDIRLYRVIYKVIEELKDAMEGLLEPELKEEVTARAEVRNIFKVPNVGIIAGLYVTEGTLNRNYKVRLIRDGIVIHEGNIGSLKRFENDVKEVKEGYECGLGIEAYNDIKVGDELEIYTYRKIKRTL